MSLLRPETLWWWSTVLHRRGHTTAAKLLKLVNFLLFHAVLPYEVELHRDVKLLHRGLGCVIHPNTTIGRQVVIGHGVTTAAPDQKIPSERRIVIGDRVLVGAHSYIGGKQGGPSLTVGDDARIGAHAIVTRDVPPGARVVSPRAVELPEVAHSAHEGAHHSK